MSRSHRVPGIWQGPLWALSGKGGPGIGRMRLAWRAFRATVAHGKAMRRWMTVLSELHIRGIVADVPSEYLRVARPHVNRHTGFGVRAVQLTDHLDWLETAFKPAAFEQLTAGKPLVLADLTPPRGCDFMRLQLQQAGAHSPEGELLLTLTLQRSADVQQKPQPVDAAAMGFSRFRVDNVACLVIGGVRGQRHPVLRLSSAELAQALSGWKPAVLMVRVAQELARVWGLRVVGLDPSSHQLQGWTYQMNKRKRDAAQRIYESYDALWEHFDAKFGPSGWMVLPMDSDEKLEATALSPEKRERQTRRADYWIRTRNLLRLQLRQLLLRPDRDSRISRVTESETLAPEDGNDDYGFVDSRDRVPSRVLESGPGSLL